jgi:chalcone isomerase-like protein
LSRRPATAFLAAIVLAFVLAGTVGAKERDGVTLEDRVTVEGKPLVLNGRLGLRVRKILLVSVKVYVIGLYLETPTTDARAILAADRIRRVDLVVRRDLSGADVSSAIAEAMNETNPTRKDALAPRIAGFQKLFPNVATGDRISLTYVPGKGTVVAIQGADKGSIPGDDFAEALFSVWLGPRPIQEDVKNDLLGR